MRIILSAAISADGYLDNTADERLVLSSPEDWKAVYALRAECDAILVGAGTLRRDNPSLVIRDRRLREQRIARGMDPDIIKVAVSGTGFLDPGLRFFTEGEGEKIVFTTGAVSKEVSEAATVISRPELSAAVITNRLRKTGIETLMVEGGSAVLSMFLREKMWDEFRLAIAPVFVGNERAPRLVSDGEYPPMTLRKIEQLGQTAVMHYENRSQYRIDYRYVLRAIRNSENAPETPERYRVGAVVVTAQGEEFDGYTGEGDAGNHAEEAAIKKALAAGVNLAGATIYSTMEPCTARKSRPETCTELIVRHGLGRVVFALREPAHLAACDGVNRLSEAEVEVTEIPAFAPDVIRINKHIII